MDWEEKQKHLVVEIKRSLIEIPLAGSYLPAKLCMAKAGGTLRVI